MAEAPGGNLLTSRWGPAPVWLWMAGSLVVLWIGAKWRDMKKAAATDQPSTADLGGDYAAEGQAVAPQFIIENNMPQQYAPVPTPTPGPAPAASQPVQTTLPGHVVITPPGTSSKPPTTSKPSPVPTMNPPSAVQHPGKKAPIPYKVHQGDTLSSIAAKHHTTWQAIWSYNTTAGNRSADTIALLRKRGPNVIFPNETILIPQ